MRSRGGEEAACPPRRVPRGSVNPPLAAEACSTGTMSHDHARPPDVTGVALFILAEISA